MTVSRTEHIIGVKVDQSGIAQIDQLKLSMQQLKQMSAQDFLKINNSGSLQKAQTDLNNVKNTVSAVETALKKAFNADLKTVNISKFNQSLKQSGVTIKQVQADYAKLGSSGNNAFRNLTTAMTTSNTKLKQSHTFLNSMADTMKNTVKWGAASSVMNSFTGSVRKAYSYVKHLDTSLNDIRIVTGKSADEMERFAKKANDAAKKLGQTTNAYTEASLIYYQQGLSDSETQARAETTLKAANVTGQTGQEVSEQLTSVWNGYKVSAAETELYVDKLAAVAATTASDLEELSTGMSKVASAANSAGVDVDQLNATLSTVISATRQAPETIGTAFKTIYARLGDLAVDGSDEFGTSLGEVSSKLKTMGIEILDSQGDMREMGTVVEEVAAKWDTWSSAQKQAAAVAMAGKRQYNNLIALFDNWDKYESALLTSANAAGTLQNQQDTYMESTAAHLKTLQSTSEDLWDSLMDTGGINFLIDGVTKVVEGMGLFTDAIGGSTGALGLLGAAGLQAFKKDIGKGITTSILNMENMKEAAMQTAEKLKFLNSINAQPSGITKNSGQKIIEGLSVIKENNMKSGLLSPNEYNESNERIQNINKSYNAIAEQNKQKEDNQAYVKKTFKAAQESDSYGNSLVETKDNLKNLTALSDHFEKNFSNSMGGVSKAANDANKSLEKIKGNLDSNNTAHAKAISNTTTAISKLNDQTNNLLKSETLSEKSRQKLTAAQAEAEKATKSLKNGTLSAANAQKIIREYEKSYRQAINDTSKNLATRIEQEKKRGQIIADNTRNIRTLVSEEIKSQRAANMQGVIQGYVGTAQALSMLTVGISSLVSAFKVLNNESMSSGEKLLQFSVSITSALASLAMGVTILLSSRAAIKTNTLQYKLLTKQQLNSAKASASALKALALENKGRLKNKAAIEAENKALRENARLKKVSVSRAGGSVRGRLGTVNSGAKGAGVFIDALDTRLTKNGNLAGKALDKLGTKVSKLVPAFANVTSKAVLGLGVVGAAAGVAALAIWGISRALDAHNIKAEKAAKKAQEANSEYTKLKSTIDTFNQKVSAYEEAEKGLDSLIKGTKEYNDQLKTANDAALELINSTKGLKANYSGDLITFDEDSLEKVRKEQELILANKQALALEAQQDANKAQYNADITNTYRSIKWDEDPDTSLDASKSEFNSAIENLARIMEDESIGFEDAIKELNLDNPELEEALKNNQDKIIELVNSNNELINSQNILEQTIAKAFLEEDSTFEGMESHEQDYMSKDMGRDKENSAEWKKYKKESEWADGGYEYDAANKEYVYKKAERSKEEAYKQYAQDNNLEYVGTTVSGKGKFKDEDGNIVKEKESDVRNELTSKDANTQYYSSDSSAFKASQAEMEGIKASVADTSSQEAGKLLEQYLLEGFSSGKFALDFGSTGALTDKDVNAQIDAVKGMKNEDILNMVKGTEMESSTEEDAEAIKKAIIEGLEAGIKPEAKEQRNQKAKETSDASLESSAETYDLDAESLKSQRDLLLENEKAIKGNVEAATKLAIQQKRMQKGQQTLNENWEDWNDILGDSNSTLADCSEVLPDVRDAVGDLLDLDTEEMELIPDEWLKDNWDLLDKALNGTEEDLANFQNAAQKAAGEEYLLKIEGAVDPNGNINSEIAEINSFISEYDMSDMVVGVSVDPAQHGQLYTSLQNIISACNMTQAEATEYLKNIGFDAKFKEVEIAPKVTSWKIENPVLDEKATQEAGVPIFTGSETLEGENQTGGGKGFALETITPNGNFGGTIGTTKLPAKTTSKAPTSSGGSSSKSTKSSGAKKDRYRKVNNELSKLENQLDKLANAQERAYGQGLLDNLNEQLDVIKNQVKWSQKKLDIARDEAKEMRTERTANYKDENGYEVKNDLQDFGIKFDSKTKEITNYNSKMQWYDDKIAELEAQWNGMSASEQEENESLGNRIDALTANRETLQTLVEEYDDLIYETIPGLENELQEKAYAEIELKLKAFNVEANLYLDTTEAIENLKDFRDTMVDYMDYSDLNAKSSFEAIAKQNKKIAENAASALLGDFKTGKNGQKVRDKTGYLGKANANLDKETGKNKDKSFLNDNNSVAKTAQDLNKMNKAYEAYKKDPKAFLADPKNKQWTGTGEDGKTYFDESGFREAMQTKFDEYTGEIEKYEQAFQDVEDALMNTIDALADSYAAQSETYDFINSQIEHQIEATKLLKGEFAYEDLKSDYKKAAENAKGKKDTAEEAMQDYEARMNKAKRDGDAEAYEKYRELYQNSIEDYQSANKEYLAALEAQKENAVRAEAEQVFGTEAEMGLADAQWEIQNLESDKYLDNVDKAYEIQKLTNKLNKDMNDASLSAQSRLAKFREDEIKKLKEKEKLTQYDVDRANKLYEIELKKIALEEAQNNKSQMRLRRDSSGNYSYQFTADEDKSADAQQELEDAQYGLREFDLEAERENQESLLNMKKEYKEKWIEYNLLSEAEQLARKAEYDEWFKYYENEMTYSALTAIETRANATSSSYDLSKELYAQDREALGTLTAEQQALLDAKHESFDTMTMDEIALIRDTMTPEWSSSMESMIKDVTGEDGLQVAWANALGKIQTQAYDTEGVLRSDWKTAMDLIINDNVGEGGIVTKWEDHTGQLKTHLSTAADGMAGAWETTMKGIADGNMAEGGIVNAWTGQTNQMGTDWEGALGTMKAQYNADDKETFAGKVKKGNEDIQTEVGKINTKIQQTATDMKKTSKTARTQAKKWLDQQKKVTTNIGKELDDLTKIREELIAQEPYWEKLKKATGTIATNTQKILNNTKTTTNNTKGTGDGEGKNNEGQGNGSGDGKVKKGEKVKLKKGGLISESSSEKPGLTTPYAGKELYVQEVNKGSKAPYHLGTSKDFDDEDTWVGWTSKAQITGFDTGGYTGDWAGEEGKLAYLHAKELILNAEDTENMLAMLKVAREAMKVSGQSLEFKDQINEIKDQLADSKASLNTAKEEWIKYMNLSVAEQSSNKGQELSQKVSDLLDAIKVSSDAKNSLEEQNNSESMISQQLEVVKQDFLNALNVFQEDKRHQTEEFKELLKSSQRDVSAGQDRAKQTAQETVQVLSDIILNLEKHLVAITEKTEKTRLALYNIRHTDFVNLLNQLTTTDGRIKNTNIRLSNIRQKDFVQLFEQLKTTDGRIENVSIRLYNIRHKDFPEVMKKQDESYDRLKLSRTILYNIRYKDFVKLFEQLATTDTRIKNARASLYNIRHTDFKDLFDLLGGKGSKKGALFSADLLAESIASVLLSLGGRLEALPGKGTGSRSSADEAMVKAAIAQSEEALHNYETPPPANVHIDAHFPGVVEFQQILDTFYALPNATSQHLGNSENEM